MQLFRQKLAQIDRGFTLIEVIVAMTIVTIFISISLQLILAATVSRVVSREKAEVTTWIEADLEAVKFRASQYLDAAKCNASTIDAGYAQGFRDAALTANGLEAPTPMTLTKTINNNSFIMTRTANPRNISPFDVLEIRYRVNSTLGLKIATIYTEVIPNAALRCP